MKKKEITIKDLRKYSIRDNFDMDSTNLNFYAVEKNDCEFGIAVNYLVDKKEFEVYLFVRDKDTVASSLLYKVFKSRLYSSLYYYLLSKLVDKKNINLIYRYLKIYERIRKKNNK